MTEIAWEEWRTLLVTYGTSIALAVGHIILILIGGWIALRVIRRALHKLEDVLIGRA